MYLKTTVARACTLSFVLTVAMALLYAHNVNAASSPAAKAVLDFDKAGAKTAKKYRIAYITECVQKSVLPGTPSGLEGCCRKIRLRVQNIRRKFQPSRAA